MVWDVSHKSFPKGHLLVMPLMIMTMRTYLSMIRYQKFLYHAASLRNATACLALGRIHAGLGRDAAPNLLDNTLVPLDFEAAKELLVRAMEAPAV